MQNPALTRQPNEIQRVHHMGRTSRVGFLAPGHWNGAAVGVIVRRAAANVVDAVDLDGPAFVLAVSDAPVKVES